MRARARVRASSRAFACPWSFFHNPTRGPTHSRTRRSRARDALASPARDFPDDLSRALADALASVNAVRTNARSSFDALDRKAIAKALVMLSEHPRANANASASASASRAREREVIAIASNANANANADMETSKEIARRVTMACALVREIDRVSAARSCANGTSAEAFELVARAGCSIRNDHALTSTIVRAFYTIARKGKGATSEAHATLRTYTDVIAALSRCARECERRGVTRQTPSPVEVWLMLRATPLKCDAAAFGAGVQAYVAEGRLEEAEKVLRDATAEGVRAGARLFNTLIAGYGREKNLRGVETSSNAMNALGVVPNQATWGVKVSAYVACERLDLAMDALEQGVRFSPRIERRPGVQAYTTLVQGLARAGRTGEAEEVLRRMARDGVKPNAYTYSALIDGLAGNAQVSLAESALAEMRRAQIMPSVVTYNSILKGVVRRIGASGVAGNDLLSQARRVFDRMRADGVSPDLVTYNTLINACIDAQAPAEAWNVLREISKSGLKPDVVTYTTLLKYFVQVGDSSATQWVLAELDTDPLMVQDVGVYNCLINAYARQGDMCRANETLLAMEEKKIPPNIATYGSLLEGYVRVGNVREAIKVYELCSTVKRFAPDARMRKSLVYGCGLHGLSDVADCLIADLQATGDEGAREARTLRFVLRAAMKAKTDEIGGRVDRSRVRKLKPRTSSKSSRATAPPPAPEVSVMSTSDADVECPAPEAQLEWNRGLEMWKYWLGLPNNYYAAGGGREDSDANVSPMKSSDATSPTLEVENS